MIFGFCLIFEVSNVLRHIFVIRNCVDRMCFGFTSSNATTESLLRKLLSAIELAARQMAAVWGTVACFIASALAQSEAETAVDLFQRSR